MQMRVDLPSVGTIIPRRPRGLPTPALLAAALLCAAAGPAPAPAPAPASAQPPVAVTQTAPPAPGALLLYDPAAPALSAAGPAPGPAAGCGSFAAPCNGLTTTTTATATTPIVRPQFGRNYDYGVDGFASFGASNHGTGESAGVRAWIKQGDTTLSIAVAVNGLQYNGKGYPYYAIGPRP